MKSEPPVKLKVVPCAVAALRNVVAIRPGRIAREHRTEQSEIFRGLDLHARAGRRQRSGRAAAEHIGAENPRPAERAVEQAAIAAVVVGRLDVAAGGRAQHEFVVGRDLADAQPNSIVEALLEPGGEQPRGRQRVDRTRVGDAADVLERVVAAVVILIDRDVRRRASPADQFFQVAVDGEFELAVVAGAPIDAAGQNRKRFADVAEGEFETVFVERGTRAVPIAGQRIARPDRGLGRCLVGCVRRRRAEEDDGGGDARPPAPQKAPPSAAHNLPSPCGDCG